ncbi:MAG: hypothetical protein V4550_07415 [Gemmatimonadota bacterium]
MSPHRVFLDDDELQWNVWDVIPSWGERRVAERRVRDGEPPTSGERRVADRRRVRGIRIALTPHLADGWLAFESAHARKRLAPIPTEWHALPEDKLRELWRAAEALPHRRRRLIE